MAPTHNTLNTLAPTQLHLKSLISVINHECFTPLHGLINLSEIAKETSENESKILFSGFNDSAIRLSYWVNLLMQIVRLENEIAINKSIEQADLLQLSYLLAQKIPANNFRSDFDADCCQELTLLFPESDFCLLVSQALIICERYQSDGSKLNISISKPEKNNTLVTFRGKLGSNYSSKWLGDNKEGVFDFKSMASDPASYIISLLVKKHGLLSNTYIRDQTINMNFLFVDQVKH